MILLYAKKEEKSLNAILRLQNKYNNRDIVIKSNSVPVNKRGFLTNLSKRKNENEFVLVFENPSLRT